MKVDQTAYRVQNLSMDVDTGQIPFKFLPTIDMII